MPLVVANNHHPNEIRSDVVEEVVRKAFQVGPPEAAIGHMESHRICGGLGNRSLEVRVELLSQTRGNVVIHSGGFQRVLPHQRMVLYLQ